MTEPVDLEQVKEVVHLLRQAYMHSHAMVIDSLAYQTTERNPWFEICALTKVASVNIYNAIENLVHATDYLRKRA